MKKSWLALSLLMLGACTTQYSFAADQALIVGVGQYQNPSANLPGIEKDVAMAQQLVAHMGFEAKNIKLLQDQQATREQFRAALKQLAQTTQPNDRVIIYISSHGSQVKDTTGSTHPPPCSGEPRYLQAWVTRQGHQWRGRSWLG